MSAGEPTSHLRVCGGLNETPHVRSGDDGQVGEAGDADQRLVDQDGVHGLLDAVLRLQRRKQHFHLLPVGGDNTKRLQPKRSRPRLARVFPKSGLIKSGSFVCFHMQVMQIMQENKALKDCFLFFSKNEHRVIGIMNNAYLLRLSIDFTFVFGL